MKLTIIALFVWILAGCSDLSLGVEDAGGVARINYIDNYYAGKYYIADYYISDTNRDACNDGYCYKPHYRHAY